MSKRGTMEAEKLLDAIGQLPEDMLHVNLHRRLGDGVPARNGLVRKTFSERSQDLPLADREGGMDRRPGRHPRVRRRGGYLRLVQIGPASEEGWIAHDDADHHGFEGNQEPGRGDVALDDCRRSHQDGSG